MGCQPSSEEANVATTHHPVSDPAEVPTSPARAVDTLFMRVGDVRSFWVCLALREMNRVVEEFEMDFANPPEWLTNVNPRGTLPTLMTCDGTVALYGADVILEYLDEVESEPFLEAAALPSEATHQIPDDSIDDYFFASSNSNHQPHTRGVTRDCNSVGSSGGPRIAIFPKDDMMELAHVHALMRIIDEFYSTAMPLLLSNAATSQEELRVRIPLLIDNIEQLVWKDSPIGPYFLGKRFSAVDAQIFAYFGTGWSYIAPHIPMDFFNQGKYPTLKRVSDAVARRPATKKLVREISEVRWFAQMWRFYRVPRGCVVFAGCCSVGAHLRESLVDDNNRDRPAAAATLLAEPSQGDSSEERRMSNSSARTLQNGSLLFSAGSDHPLQTSTARRFALLRGEALGRGAHGCVYKAFDSERGIYCAVKETRAKAIAYGCNGGLVYNQLQESIQREFELVVSLEHPNIVTLIALELNSAATRIYMEWMPMGSVADVLGQNGPLSENVVRQHFKHLLSALAYIHEKGIIHRDIKPGNLLLSTSGVVKLSDFGSDFKKLDESGGGECDRRQQEAADPHAHCPISLSDARPEGNPENARGTLPYMSREAIAGRHSQATDIWALALTVGEMLTGRAPWAERPRDSPLQLMFHILHAEPGQHFPRLPSREEASPRLIALLGRCLAFEPASRPSAAELLRHDYFQADDLLYSSGGGI